MSANDIIRNQAAREATKRGCTFFSLPLGPLRDWDQVRYSRNYERAAVGGRLVFRVRRGADGGLDYSAE